MATKPHFVVWQPRDVSEGSSLRLHRRRIPLRETPLVPIGIDKRCGAGGIEFSELLRSEVPAYPRPGDPGDLVLKQFSGARPSRFRILQDDIAKPAWVAVDKQHRRSASPRLIVIIENLNLNESTIKDKMARDRIFIVICGSRLINKGCG